MMTLGRASLLAAMLAGAACASAADIRGVVFDDRNRNGVRDPDEAGLPGVAVSNGTEVTLTGADGGYELPFRDGALIFVVKPPGWQPPLSPQNLPELYARPPKTAGTGTVDFPLRRAAESDRFRALVFTDTQPISLKEVGYLDRTLVDGLAGRRDFAFGVTLGDVTSDRPDFYPAINAVIARVGVPWFNLNGNHDLNLGSRDDRGSVASFEAAYGPSTYAFRWGRALFVALNDVRYLGGPRFVGGLRPDQFAFLENLLRVTPPDTLVVVMLHIPLFPSEPPNAPIFRAADRARLFALLQDRPHVLVLSGHTHYQRHVFYGRADGWRGTQPLHEYNVAAACGSFWGGPADAQGLPISTMWDGAPHGYAVLTCEGTEVRLDYVPAGHPADFQIGLHVPETVAPRQGYVSFYANVFNGHDGWTVEARVDDRSWLPMRRVLAWDPSYAELYLAQDGPAPPVLAGPRLPDPMICYHLWRAYLPADLATGPHRIEVRAVDPSGRPFTAGQAFRVTSP